MDLTLWSLFAATFAGALLTALATGLGALPLAFVGRVGRRRAGELKGGAAGMMAAASAALVVEGLARTGHAGGWDVWSGVAAGAVCFAVLDWYASVRDGFDILSLRRRRGVTALLVVVGMTIHSFPEGVAVGVAFGSANASGSLGFGVAMSLAIAAHNVPEGLAIALALRPMGVGLRGCVGWAIFSSAPQPIAAVPAAGMVWVFEPVLAGGLGFAAGAMLLLVARRLFPEAAAEAGRARAAAGAGIGAALTLVLVASLGLVA